MIKETVAESIRCAPRRALLFLAPATLLCLPQAGRAAECFERISRMPMSAAAPSPGAAPYRAHMLRTGAAARPRLAHPHRPSAHRPVTRVAKTQIVSHRPRPVLARAVQPTPYATAAWAAAAPAAYTLISTTICNNGAAPLPLVAGPDQTPGVTAFPEGTVAPGSGFPPGGVFPPDIGGVFPPGGGFPPLFPPPPLVGPPVGPLPPPQPPTVGPLPVPPPGPDTPPGPPTGPPTTTPLVDTPPPVAPPVTPPDTGGPPTPPFGPPTETPPVGPPVGPTPLIPDTPPPPPLPPVVAIPEPGAWALMLLGFGMIGAALRRARQGQGLRG